MQSTGKYTLYDYYPNKLGIAKTKNRRFTFHIVTNSGNKSIK